MKTNNQEWIQVKARKDSECGCDTCGCMIAKGEEICYKPGERKSMKIACYERYVSAPRTSHERKTDEPAYLPSTTGANAGPAAPAAPVAPAPVQTYVWVAPQTEKAEPVKRFYVSTRTAVIVAILLLVGYFGVDAYGPAVPGHQLSPKEVTAQKNARIQELQQQLDMKRLNEMIEQKAQQKKAAKASAASASGHVVINHKTDHVITDTQAATQQPVVVAAKLSHQWDGYGDYEHMAK